MPDFDFGEELESAVVEDPTTEEETTDAELEDNAAEEAEDQNAAENENDISDAFSTDINNPVSEDAFNMEESDDSVITNTDTESATAQAWAEQDENLATADSSESVSNTSEKSDTASMVANAFAETALDDSAGGTTTSSEPTSTSVDTKSADTDTATVATNQKTELDALQERAAMIGGTVDTEQLSNYLKKSIDSISEKESILEFVEANQDDFAAKLALAEKRMGSTNMDDADYYDVAISQMRASVAFDEMVANITVDTASEIVATYLASTNDDFYTVQNRAVSYVSDHQDLIDVKLQDIADRFGIDNITADNFVRATQLMREVDRCQVVDYAAFKESGDTNNYVYENYSQSEIMGMGADTGDTTTSSFSLVRNTNEEDMLSESEAFDEDNDYSVVSENITAVRTMLENADTDPSFVKSDIPADGLIGLTDNVSFANECKAKVANVANDLDLAEFEPSKTLTYSGLVDAVNAAADGATLLDTEQMSANGIKSIDDVDVYVNAKIAVDLYDSADFAEYRERDEIKEALGLNDGTSDDKKVDTIIETLIQGKEPLTASADEDSSEINAEWTNKITALRKKYALEALNKALDAPAEKSALVTADSVDSLIESSLSGLQTDIARYGIRTAVRGQRALVEVVDAATVVDFFSNLDPDEFYDFVDFMGEMRKIITEKTDFQESSKDDTMSSFTSSDKSNYLSYLNETITSKINEYYTNNKSDAMSDLTLEQFTAIATYETAGSRSLGFNTLNPDIYEALKLFMTKQQVATLGDNSLGSAINKQSAAISNLGDALDLASAKESLYVEFLEKIQLNKK